MAHQQLMDSMRELTLRMHRLFNIELKAQGTSLAQLKLLLFIEHMAQARAIDISEAFGFAPRTVTEAIDGLERDGLVRRDPVPNDRRAKYIRVTDAGSKVISDAAPARQAIASRIFQALTPTEEQELLRLVKVLNDRLMEVEAPHLRGEHSQPKTKSSEQ
ncbi:MarR family transcriptional regulator [Sphingobium sp. SCG-1]|uniref:MarR family winged helix-turn-helix transcriptional regulator n=1 Tax=Sphingobium sp. SCG-1 TaxID=2072936 RepID=UPI000CD6B1B2|nr:MarR family transcriptional regulator [Sphingobium sp. SCG-1]AUW59602.1 MarR family transcriptional regulator [Sphingobium sp. SCG-1]